MSEFIIQSPEIYGLTSDALLEIMAHDMDVIHSREGIMEESRLLLDRKNVVATYNKNMELLGRIQAKEAEFYEQSKLYPLLKKEVIPFLLSIYKGNDDCLMAKMKQSAPNDHAALLEEYAKWEDTLRAKLRPDQRFAIALRLYNDCFIEVGAMIIRLSDYWKGGNYTLAIAKVHENEQWLISEGNDIVFYETEVLFPFLGSSSMGSFDRNIGSWVDITSCFKKAFEFFAQRQGRLCFPMLELGAQHSFRYENVEALSQALAHHALYEEIKHQINFYHRVIAPGNEDKHGNRIQFLQERLLVTSNFVIPPESSPIDERLQFANNIEELNAKLTVMAFSPDPHLEVAMHYNTFQVESQFIQPSRLCEGSIIAALLMNADARALGPGALVDIMSWPDKTLRKAALDALKRTFREEFENLPFCGLDENGNLVETPRTHPFFYQWQ